MKNLQICVYFVILEKNSYKIFYVLIWILKINIILMLQINITQIKCVYIYIYILFSILSSTTLSQLQGIIILDLRFIFYFFLY